MKPFLWLLSPHSQHLFNLLLTRESGEAETCLWRLGWGLFCPSRMSRVCLWVKTKARERGLEFEGVLRVSGHLPHPFQLPWNQIWGQATKVEGSPIILPCVLNTPTWFYDGVVCCRQFGLKSQAFCTPADGFHLKPVSSTILGKLKGHSLVVGFQNPGQSGGSVASAVDMEAAFEKLSSRFL